MTDLGPLCKAVSANSDAIKLNARTIQRLVAANEQLRTEVDVLKALPRPVDLQLLVLRVLVVLTLTMLALTWWKIRCS